MANNERRFYAPTSPIVLADDALSSFTMVAPDVSGRSCEDKFHLTRRMHAGWKKEPNSDNSNLNTRRKLSANLSIQGSLFLDLPCKMFGCKASEGTRAQAEASDKRGGTRGDQSRSVKGQLYPIGRPRPGEVRDGRWIPGFTSSNPSPGATDTKPLMVESTSHSNPMRVTSAHLSQIQRG